MRFFCFFYILIVSLQISFSQSWRLSFTSKVEENGLGCNSAEISLYKNNAFIEKKTTGIDGRFSFTLEPNGDYRIDITKPGYVKKMFAVSTRGVPEEVNQDFPPIDLKAVVLFEPLKECDLSALNKPLLRFAYDPNTKDFEYDKNEFDLAQEALAQISDCEKMAVANAKKFTKLMQEGKNFIAKKDCKNASIKFTQALELKPNNEEATKALKESDDICSGHAQNDLKYKQTMDSGALSVSSKNYEVAIAQYQRALLIKPGEKDPPKKIDEIRALIKVDENEK
ncbi:MAG: carboxypeptidase-like regulatory domain-containing protein, partial [Bacteroidota bacterium]